MTRRGIWRIERIDRAEGPASTLPLLISIASDEKLFQLRAPGMWPPPGKSLFAMRAEALRENEHATVVEEFPVLINAVHGAETASGKWASTINLSIDRPSRKLCSVLVTRQRKTDGAIKEVIFLRTEKSTKAHRSRTYIQPTSLRNIAEIVIDTRERYPWSFAAAKVTKAALKSGDYAMRVDEKVRAVVERKSFVNMLANLASLESYHAHLHDLASYPAAALVIEAQYRDFLDPAKTKPMAATRCGRALADIAAKHPNLQVIFAGNRKDANVWAAHFFEACGAMSAGTRDASDQATLSLPDALQRQNMGGIDADVRHAIMHTLPAELRISDLMLHFPAISQARLSNCLKALRSEGKMGTRGKGRATVWIRET